MNLVLPEFTEEVYDEHLNDLEPKWSKEETFYLWDLLKTYEMRFFVVFDRYDVDKFPRTIDEIKHRFYMISRKLAELKNDKNSPFFSYEFDYSYEQYRKF
jgi:DNA methyltransferase 1-associated protein 1